MSKAQTVESTEVRNKLEELALHQLLSDWNRLNATLFKAKMQPPLFALHDATATLGRWNATNRSLEMSRTHIFGYSWAQVIEVLKHEMAHQYVSEILRVEDESPHGATFRGLCERLGIDAAASGVPMDTKVSEEKMGKLIQKVHRLLALAESSNVHEAESAMEAAHMLMLKHNLDLSTSASSQAYRFQQLGLPKKRILAPENTVASILTRFFFVQGLWTFGYDSSQGVSGRVLEVCGTSENVEMASYVYEFLHKASERLWAEHQKVHQIRGNRDRVGFLTGVMRGFEEKLIKQAERSNRAGLVWVPHGDLLKYFRRRHPHVRTARYSGPRLTDAYQQGKKAGGAIVLHKPIQAGGVQRSPDRGRELAPRRG